MAFCFVGHTVYEEGLKGKTICTIFDICQKEKMVLMTLDLDFFDIRTSPPKPARVFDGARTTRLMKRVFINSRIGGAKNEGY